MRNFIGVLVLLAIAFGGGFWWEHQRTASVQEKLDAASAQLAQASSSLSLYRLQDQLLTLVGDTASKNYGDAASVSTSFFDNVNDELSRAGQSAVKSALQSILAQRDQVTAQLAKGDPASHDSFVQMSVALHQAMQAPPSAP